MTTDAQRARNMRRSRSTTALPPPMTARDWRDDAACKGTPIWWWYAPEGESDDVVVPEAIERCRQCPVRTQCLEHAIAAEDNGMWAGETPDTLRRRRRTAGIRLHRSAEPPLTAGVPSSYLPPNPFPAEVSDDAPPQMAWSPRRTAGQPRP